MKAGLTLNEVMLVAVAMLGIGWSAVTVLLLVDRLRGIPVPDPTIGRGHSARIRSLEWSQLLVRLPLYLLFVPAFLVSLLILVPPQYVVAKTCRLLSKKKPSSDQPSNKSNDLEE